MLLCCSYVGGVWRSVEADHGGDDLSGGLLAVEEAAGANPFDFKFMFLGIRGDDQPTDALSFSAFSASWRASMQSSMSPSMKAGRLCMDQPMRWSVTRDWG